MRKSTSIVAILLMAVTLAPRVQAQTGVASQALLDAAVQQHVATTEANRATVLRVLDHPDVKAVAGRLGVDLRTAADAVSTLDGQDLQTLTAQANQVDEALAGGQSRVVISTTLNHHRAPGPHPHHCCRGLTMMRSGATERTEGGDHVPTQFPASSRPC